MKPVSCTKERTHPGPTPKSLIDPHRASEKRTDPCPTDHDQSRSSLVPPIDRNYSAYLWAQPQDIFVIPAHHQECANSAARSRSRLQHRQQCTQMIGVESRLRRDAATPTEPDLDRLGLLQNPNLAQRLSRLDLHFDALCLFRLSQSPFPGKHLRRRHPAFFAKCRHALTTRDLLGHDRTPLLPKTRAMFCHELKVTHVRALNKMAFRYRSRNC